MNEEDINKINNIPILLIEDNPDDIELTKMALKRGDIFNLFYIIRDGQEAIEFFEKTAENEIEYPLPGLILLDINLPRVDGINVLKFIKGSPKLKRIPVIIFTTSSRNKDIVESYEMGVNSYIQKPVAFNKFIETIKTIERYWVLTNTPPLLDI